MHPIYNIGIRLYRLGIGIASMFNPKARLWISGRWAWEEKLKEGIGDSTDWIWFHCASLGEFEQGRPLIEAIKTLHPERKVLLSFFSPSGYELRKSYAFADHVCYLPLDTASNAKAFLDIVKPSLVLFVKYDLWLNFIGEIHNRGIHMVLVSALVRKESRFLTSMMRRQYRNAFRSFSWIFTQDQNSAHLLEEFAQMDRISVAGDTRFDRAAALLEKFHPVPEIESFLKGRKCIIAGSTWPADEQILLPVIHELRRDNLCWLIAPHEIHPERIHRFVTASNGRMQKLSNIEECGPETDVLWIDSIGLLSRLYHYSEFVYIGGGFGEGIHNTQEPAVYGNPVIFGPNYSGFQEAVDMVDAGGAVSVQDKASLKATIVHWLEHPTEVARIRLQNAGYMRSKTGATPAIIAKLKLLNYL